jgi:hypothetical protein
MSSVESSVINKRYLVVGTSSTGGNVGQLGTYGSLPLGDYDNFADAISALAAAQAYDNSSNYYVVEAWTCLPNPAS